MPVLPTTAVIPLFTDPQGTIRVRGSRVTLDAVVTAFRAGATAEGIAQRFPTVALADVYPIIAHYLNNTTEIDAYLSQREGEVQRGARKDHSHIAVLRSRGRSVRSLACGQEKSQGRSRVELAGVCWPSI